MSRSKKQIFASERNSSKMHITGMITRLRGIRKVAIDSEKHRLNEIEKEMLLLLTDWDSNYESAKLKNLKL